MEHVSDGVMRRQIGLEPGRGREFVKKRRPDVRVFSCPLTGVRRVGRIEFELSYFPRKHIIAFYGRLNVIVREGGEPLEEEHRLNLSLDLFHG